MTLMLLRTVALLSILVLGACAGGSSQTSGLSTRAEYAAVQDGGYFIEAVEERHLTDGQARTDVSYAGDDAPGTIVVDTFARRLYHVQDGGRATRYAIAVGREGLSFRGSGVIGRKEEWPAWRPTANMVRTRPDLYAEYAAGLPGGLDNPLGARALYLYRGGRDSLFRIHGTVQNASIGHATSAGCIRLFNQDAIDLYNRVDMGTVVKVRSQEESLALEGPIMDDAFGRAVPETPQNIALRDRQAAQVAAAAEQQAREAELAAQDAARDAARADRQRLAACRRSGIDVEDCPRVDASTS